MWGEPLHRYLIVMTRLLNNDVTIAEESTITAD